jgi:hypothetical protein
MVIHRPRSQIAVQSSFLCQLFKLFLIFLLNNHSPIVTLVPNFYFHFFFPNHKLSFRQSKGGDSKRVLRSMVQRFIFQVRPSQNYLISSHTPKKEKQAIICTWCNHKTHAIQQYPQAGHTYQMICYLYKIQIQIFTSQIFFAHMLNNIPKLATHIK